MSADPMNYMKICVAKAIRLMVIKYYRLMGVRIGRNVFISHKAKIDTTYRDGVIIGDGSYITYGAIILAHDHAVYRLVPFSEDNGRGKTILGKRVFVGAGAIILRNVSIGDNAVIAAGAVVTQDVKENSVVAGNPASVVRSFRPISP